MLVKELIQELQKYNPEVEVNFSCGIESGRSYDSCSSGDLSIEMEDLEEDEIREKLIHEMGYNDEEDLDEDEVEELNNLVKNYKPRVDINISGECTDYQ